MDFDVDSHVDAVERSVSSPERDGQPASAVTLARAFETTVEDVWDAVTNVERIPRWFLPVSGDTALGGRYQLEGNASGVITACEPQSHVALTWEFGGDVSWVEVGVSAERAGRARLTLPHIAILSEQWTEYGPGATGVGWELALRGLSMHLAQPSGPQLDEARFVASPGGRALIAGSSEAWAQAAIEAGTEPAAAREAATRTTAFYTGEPS